MAVTMNLFEMFVLSFFRWFSGMVMVLQTPAYRIFYNLVDV